MTITEDQLEAWIRQLIKENKLEKFYKWREWRELSEQIKKENNYECQLCKKRGIHTFHCVKRATMSNTQTKG